MTPRPLTPTTLVRSLSVALCCCRAEHQRCKPSCPFLKIKDPYHITVKDMIELEKKALEAFVVSEATECGLSL